ncbi:MAG: hypothetical protein COV59_01670 [Candidatus Magasanikbacteria bacterium CG11_big_fil_rev_8_21_14_0_20_39_34]|uniref:MobA-like NTP transferase domain-containing protein n=1 Tax=Candidatus Magasanikbacteria bacterium CG11_big_fil_rev_8_21_14_0_20_39_34 TaxID=1974653 RepID=A0A2H0N601_9BACT|nr:MAG: hypothetical protein COV59_01670 [Candidatus Magasanikbacteria bacterium CG11_big_fil_rev_8_21_14_0_20_39_34]
MLQKNSHPKIGAIILAAGHGTRMNSDIPKVMHMLDGKPLVDHVVTHVEETGICEKPVLVVSSKHSYVQDHLGDRARYVVQSEQLGTGHATSMAREILEGKVEHVVVLYGDMPFVSSDSIFRLVERHVERENAITLMTITVPDFEGKYAPFYSFSRIIRREQDGHIARDVQKKDCTPEELEIKELNPCYFCFRSEWLWGHIDKLTTDNAQGEYYLTDLLQMAIDNHEKISSIAIDPMEAIGVNTKDDLEVAQKLLK